MGNLNPIPQRLGFEMVVRDSRAMQNPDQISATTFVRRIVLWQLA
jgi:hypothetical protein